jgi:hypothetical protein
MARKYYGSFKSIDNITHRVEIWDGPNGTTPEILTGLYATRVTAAGGFQEGAGCLSTKLNALSGSTELRLSGEGYTITRKGEGDALYTNYIRPSKISSYWVIPNDTVLNDFESISTVTEQYWAVLVYKDGVLDYVGRVLADQLSRFREAIQAKPVIELVAVDGLELLSGYKVDPSNFTDGKIQISQLFRRALDNLALKEYWVVNGTQTDYFREASTVYNSVAYRKGFDFEEVDLNTFVSGYDQFKDVRATDVNQFIYAANDMLDYAAAIEQLCEIKQARLIHSQGKYWLVSFAEYIDTTITYRIYSYTLQFQNSTATYAHRQALGSTSVRPQWLYKPTLTHQVAAKYVEIDTERHLGVGIYRSWNNKTSTALGDAFTDIPTGTNVNEHPLRVRFNVKFAKDYIMWPPVTGLLYPESYSIVKVKMWLTSAGGLIKVLDNTNYFWVNPVVGAPIPEFEEKMDTSNEAGTWCTFNFDKNLTTPPAYYDTLHVSITVESVFPIFSKSGKPTSKTASPVAKDFWGAINVAFADASPYNNPDFTFDISEIYTPDAANSVNSVPVILKPKYYSSNTKYATGVIRVFDGTNYQTAASTWYAGWDSVTHGTITEMLGNSVAGLYKDFMPVIQGTWVDSGTLTAVKSLYFDNYTWILQGCQYSAKSEQWAGEWVAIIPTYTGISGSGEGLMVGSGLKDRVNYLDMQVSNINDQLSGISDAVKSTLSNDVSGSPTAVPTVNTSYEVMLQYDAANTVMEWRLQEHGTFKTYTVGTFALDVNFEGALADCAGGSIILNLPATNVSKGKRYYFVKKGSAHNLRIDGAGANISGADHIDLSTNYSTATLICDGTEWFRIA